MNEVAVPTGGAPRSLRPPAPAVRLLVGLVGANVLAIGMIVALASLSLAASREVFHERAMEACDNLARSLAQTLSGRFQSVDQTLKALSLDVVSASTVVPFTEDVARQLLIDQHALTPGIDALRLFEPSGRTVQYPAGRPASPEAVRASAETAALAADRMRVSEPLPAAESGRWMLLLSRRIQALENGRDAGVIQAEIDLDHLRRLLQEVEVGRQGAVTLRSPTMKLITRRTGEPDAPTLVGSSRISPELEDMVRRQPDAGSYIAHTALDGVERATAYRRLPDTGMLVLVGLGTADFLLPWQAQVRQVAALSALLAITLAGASIAAYRSWQRVAASRAEAQAEARWHRALLRTASDGMHVLDNEGRLVELSESFSAGLGYRREELLGQSVTLWDPAARLDELQPLFEQPSFRLKRRHRHRDGHWIEVEITGTVLQIEQARWLFCAARDVTERNQTARELQTHRDELERLVTRRTAELHAGEARFRAFMSATPATAWIKDERGRMLYANAAWEKALEQPDARWSGRTAFDLLPAPMAQALQANDDEVLRTDRPVETVESTRGADGQDRHWQTVKFPLHGPDGSRQVGGIAIDITGQVDAEAERAAALLREQALRDAAERQADRLREAIRERDEFVRVMAHEVRQPLNNASAALESAAAELAPGQQVVPEQAMQRVRRAQGVIGQIVGALDNTLAATALLTSGNDRIAGHDVDVDVLINLSLADLPAAQRDRVRVERISSTRTASMDSGLMRLALRNVLVNALGYSPTGTEVVLRVTDSDEPLALVFEVLDAGPGVSDALRPKLFERGVRGQHHVPGHGIGLYVVRRVMELHGGSVDLRPNQPVGTVFRLSLPQDR